MSDLRFSRYVQSVVQLQPDGAGGLVPVEIYRKAGPPGKPSSNACPYAEAPRASAVARVIAARERLDIRLAYTPPAIRFMESVLKRARFLPLWEASECRAVSCTSCPRTCAKR